MLLIKLQCGTILEARIGIQYLRYRNNNFELTLASLSFLILLREVFLQASCIDSRILLPDGASSLWRLPQ
jgi:hypothetical protein